MSVSSSGFNSTSLTQPLIQVGGLASGLDTNSIISEMMQAESIPLTQLQNQQTIQRFKQSVLQGFQTQLQTLSNDIQALHSDDLFAPTQSITSSDSTKVTGTSPTGAGVGSYQIDVQQLATSAQRTFTWNVPTADGTVTIDGVNYDVRAGETSQEFVADLNSHDGSTVYGAATDTRNNTIVLSSRTTGDTGGTFINVSANPGVLSENAARAKDGRNAIYSIDGVQGTSRSNTISTDNLDPSDTTSPVIDGVTLTLTGVTSTSGPVTLNVGAPAPDPTKVTAALRQFVTDYNSVVDSITARLNERSVSNPQSISDMEQGVLFGDTDLNDLLNTLREAVYTPIAGLPDGMNSLADLGISTGAPSATSTQSSLDGDLTLDTSALNAALTSNPRGVQDLLLGTSSTAGWGQTFQRLVDGAGQAGGLLDNSIQSAGDTVSDLQTQIDNMNERLTIYQQTLQTEFTNMEVAVSQNQSTSSWLTSQLAGLAANG